MEAMETGRMRYTQVQTPRGTRDFLGREAAEKRALDDALYRVFSSWGYQEVLTPTVEFFEALAMGDGPDLERKMFRFFDRDGHILALRPEMTTPIGRVVATRLREAPKPLRLCYFASVFRDDDSQAGRAREFRQAGVELVGSSSPAADAEVVVLALEAARAAGLQGFRLDIGHIEYFRGLLEEAGLEGEARRQVRQALLQRDYVALEEVLERVSLEGPSGDALRQLPRLRGNRDVLERARGLTRHPRALAALDSLEAVLAVIDDYGAAGEVHLDLGMIKDLDYYTGLVLEGYSEALGFPLCTGGRYDGLIGRFGYPCPATGFAMSTELVLAALARQRGAGEEGGYPGRAKEPVRWLVGADGEASRREALAAARRLREAGETVEVALEAGEPEALRRCAAERGIPAVVCFRGHGQPPRVDGPSEAVERFHRLWRGTGA